MRPADVPRRGAAPALVLALFAATGLEVQQPQRVDVSRVLIDVRVGSRWSPGSARRSDERRMPSRMRCACLGTRSKGSLGRNRSS